LPWCSVEMLPSCHGVDFFKFVRFQGVRVSSSDGFKLSGCPEVLSSKLPGCQGVEW
jgi:hypothetical protein